MTQGQVQSAANRPRIFVYRVCREAECFHIRLSSFCKVSLYFYFETADCKVEPCFMQG